MRTMLIGGPLGVKDLPGPKPTALPPEIFPFINEAKTTAAGLLWRAGVGKARTALTAIRTVEPQTHDMSGLVGPDARAKTGAGHFLHYTQYTSREFLICEGRDILMSRNAKAVIAASGGIIEEFNVGGAAGLPPDLMTLDFQHTADGWSAAEARMARAPGLNVPLCHFGLATFGHFMLDGLLQVFLFRDVLASGEAKLLHWPLAHEWMEPVLTRCGAPARARREVDADLVLMQRAALSSALAGHGVYFPNSLSMSFFSWLRTVFDLEDAKGPERLYVRRPAGYARGISNADELEALALARGFHVLCPQETSIHDQAKAFSAASVVMSAWGSSLTLAPLMRSGRTVVELLPASVTDAWFPRQAIVHGLDYRPLVHASDEAGNIEADLKAVDEALSRLPT